MTEEPTKSLEEVIEESPSKWVITGSKLTGNEYLAQAIRTHILSQMKEKDFCNCRSDLIKILD